VTEAVAAVRQGRQDAAGSRLAQRGADLGRRSTDERRDQPLVDGPAGHREGPDDGQRRGIEAGDPRQEEVDQRWRVREGGVRGSAGREKLFREERVALGAAPDRAEDLVGDRPVGHRLELAEDVVARQPAKIDAHRARRSSELGQPGPDRMAEREIVRSAGQDGDEPVIRDVPDEKGHEVARRRIDPLDVLEDREHGLIVAEAFQDTEEALEQARPIDRRIDRTGVGRGRSVAPRVERGDLRDERSEVRAGGAEHGAHAISRRRSHELPQRLDERQVRQGLALEIEARAVEDRRSVRRRPVDGVGDEPCLADSGLAPDDGDDRTALGRELPGAIDPRQIGVATDGDRARSGRHAADGTTDDPRSEP